MVSPRKSRRKSACFSSTTTSTPARASRKPSISPHGPPPTMQHRVECCSAAIRAPLAEDRQRTTDDGCPLRGSNLEPSHPSSVVSLPSSDCALHPDHPLAHHVAGEQQRAEGDDQQRRADLDAAH